MIEDIKIKFDNEDLNNRINNISDKVGEIRNIYTNISNELDTMNWHGEAANKCVEMHNVIGLYQEEIFCVLEEFVNIVNRLNKNIDIFCTESDLINSIKSIQ